jgi:transposase
LRGRWRRAASKASTESVLLALFSEPDRDAASALSDVVSAHTRVSARLARLEPERRHPQKTLHEAAAASAPLEQELIDAAVASDLLHADETSWPQGGELLWLWVFTSATVTLFVVAKRGREILDRLLAGWLMSDGWSAYRHFPQRLRCWAHLTRKAQGSIDSCEREAQAFGHQVQDTFDS